MPNTLFETIQHKNMASKCKSNKFKKNTMYFVQTFVQTDICGNLVNTKYIFILVFLIYFTTIVQRLHHTF